MNISVFDIFKIGIGPSSSHTVGPMTAAKDFLTTLENTGQLSAVRKIQIDLYGSLALTGKGHGTDKALIMGLLGEQPKTIDPDSIPQKLATIKASGQIHLLQRQSIPFEESEDLKFHFTEVLPKHTNGMRFSVYGDSRNLIHSQVYYSIGGGFIVTEEAFDTSAADEVSSIPYPFSSAAELLQLCHEHDLTISELMMANEKTFRTEEAIQKGLLEIADIMSACIVKGYQTEGILPGGLYVKRRAAALHQTLQHKNESSNPPYDIMNWLNMYAMAVNEENAAGGKVVTAPTNGAAGIIPAILQYYKDFCTGATQTGVIDFLLTAAAIGILYKLRASISGAEVGCQGEVGVACSMAAGALAAVLGGTLAQVENAAEIGMEHNLGLPCDPPKGLVQIPCIERNAMGAVKALNAAQLALAENGQHKVSLDAVINTMRQIGKDMMSIYKETSLGGLAVNVIEC